MNPNSDFNCVLVFGTGHCSTALIRSGSGEVSQLSSLYSKTVRELASNLHFLVFTVKPASLKRF